MRASIALSDVTDVRDRELTFINTDFTVLDRADRMIESPLPVKTTRMRSPLPTPAECVLGTASVVALTYLFTCGGALGSESLVPTGGPLLAVFGLVLYPVVCSVPYAYVISELAASFPEEDGGLAVWVQHAFGSFVAIQAGAWAWLAAVVSMAMVPHLALQLIARLTDRPVENGYIVQAGIVVLLAAPILMGARRLTRVCILLTGVIVLATLVFSTWGLAEATRNGAEALLELRRTKTSDSNATLLESKTEPANASLHDDEDTAVMTMAVDWGQWVHTLVGHYGGLHMAAVMARQVSAPRVVYSRALWFVVALTVATLISPLVAAVCSEAVPWEKFSVGSYEAAAHQLGGASLRAVVATASLATVLGVLFSAGFCSTTQLSGMAEARLLPATLAGRSSPRCSAHYSLLATVVAVLLVLTVVPEPKELRRVGNTLSCLAATSVFLAAIQIRHDMPCMNRPVRAPGGLGVLVAFAVMPTALCGGLLVHTLTTGPWNTALVVVVLVVLPMVYGGYHAHCEKRMSMSVAMSLSM